jgi:hypothetical protein
VCPVDEQTGAAYAASNCSGLQIGDTCSQDCAFGYENVNMGGSYTCDGFGDVSGFAVQCEPIYCDKDQYVDNFVCTDCTSGLFSIPQQILAENTVCTADPVVTCAFTAQDELLAFYVNDQEIDVDVVSSTVYFLDQLGASGAVLGVAMKVDDCEDGCSTQGGFELACLSDNADSYWNMVYTDTSDVWTSYSGPTAQDEIADWTTPGFDTSIWRAPLPADVTCSDCTDINANAVGILGNPGLLASGSAFPYNWIRTAICENEPDFGPGYELLAKTSRTERSTTCAEGYVAVQGESSTSVCDESGSWSALSSCDVRPSVVCQFSGDGITAVYIDGDDVTANATDEGNGVSQLVFFDDSRRFTAERAVIAVKASGNTGLWFSCSTTGSGMLDSNWNEVQSDASSWLTYASDTPLRANWFFANRDLSAYSAPTEASTGSEAGTSKTITVVNSGTEQYFRTAFCSKEDQQGQGYAFASDTGSHVMGAVRENICSGNLFQEVVAGTPPTDKTCGTNALWSDSTGCEQKSDTTCYFMSDGTIDTVYYNNRDVTADVVGDLADPSEVKEVSFTWSDVRKVLAVSVISDDTCVTGDCQAFTGFAYACTSGDADSAWNAVHSGTNTKTNSAVSDTTTSEAPWEQWYLQNIFNDEEWYAPLASSSGLDISAVEGINANAELIWADSYYTVDPEGYQFAYFRTAVCSVDASTDKYDVADGDSNIGATRTYTCSIQNIATVGTTTCTSNGVWSQLRIDGCEEDQPPPPPPATYCESNLPHSFITGQVLDNYPTYTGNDAVYFSLMMFTFHEESVTMQLRNFVGDQACAGNRDRSIAESCGIFIMSGTSCEAPGLPHYNQAVVTENPWTNNNAFYRVGQNINREINHGYGYEDTVGHAVVVYDIFGAPMACTTIPRQDKSTQSISFTGELGSVASYNGIVTTPTTVENLRLSFGGKEVDISYSNLVADARCANGAGSANNGRSCRLEVNDRSTCETRGGSLWADRNSGFDNPWLTSTYTDGISDAFTVVNCVYYEDTVGRALHIYDYDGKWMNCEVIFPDEYAEVPTIVVTDMQVLADYTEDTSVINNVNVGTIYMSFLDDQSIQFSYNNLDVDPDCDSARACGCIANECAIQIYEATSCANIVRGESFDNADADSSLVNPWKAAYYFSSSNAGRSFNVKTDKDFDDFAGRTLVIHDRAGNPVLCTVLENGPSALLIDSAMSTLPTVLAVIMVILAF